MKNIEQQSEAPLQDPYWTEKGTPKEQFDVVFGDRKIDIKNFSDTRLTSGQLRTLQNTIAGFSQIDSGSVFGKIKSIFIDNEQPVDTELKEGLSGMGVEKGDGIIKLYPRALKPISHRVKGVPNLEGTLIHEFTHALVDANSAADLEWKQKFGWFVLREKYEELERLDLIDKLQLPQREWPKLHPDIWNLVRIWANKQSARCVTDYARRGPEDDIADSMVAAIKNPKILDPERLKFLQEKFLTGLDPEKFPKVDITEKK